MVLVAVAYHLTIPSRLTENNLLLSPKQITGSHLKLYGFAGFALKVKVVLAEAGKHCGFVPSGSLVVNVNSTEPFATSSADGVYFAVILVALS